MNRDLNRLLRGGDRLLIKLACISLFYCDGVLRTIAETSTEAVTEIVGNQFCFAVDNLNSSFGTGRNAQAAAVTFFFVNFYDIADHNKPPGSGWCFVFVESILPPLPFVRLDNDQ